VSVSGVSDCGCSMSVGGEYVSGWSISLAGESK
jgi:hypothetical protein